MTAQTGDHPGPARVEELPAWQRARRDRIVQAGLQVLARLEYDQIQIRDVAEAAKVARATLYRYFSSKDHLYACVLQEWSALDRPDPDFPARYTAEDRVRVWIKEVIGAIERQPQFFKAIIALLDSPDPNARAVMVRLSTDSLARLARFFEVLGPGRAEDTAKLLFAVVNTLTMNAIYHDETMSEVYRLVDRFIDSVAGDLR